LDLKSKTYMKRVLLISSLFVFLYACNSSDDTSSATPETTPPKEKETPEVTEKAPDLSTNPDYEKGLALVAKSGCLACHSVSEKIIGPSYREIANKYAGMSDTIVTHLANKVRAGGTGVWGTNVMAPQPHIPQEDAEAMVRYVLLLKN
jgi:cytochrome c